MVRAIHENNLSELKKLLKESNLKNPIIVEYFNTPLTALHYSAAEGKLDIFKSISESLNQVQPKAISGNWKGSTPLHFASFNGHLHIITYMLRLLFSIFMY